MNVLKMALITIVAILTLIIGFIPMLLFMYVTELWVKPIRLIRQTERLGAEEYWNDSLLRSVFNVRRHELKSASLRLALGWSIVTGLTALAFELLVNPMAAMNMFHGSVVALIVVCMLCAHVSSLSLSRNLSQDEVLLKQRLGARLEQPALF